MGDIADMMLDGTLCEGCGVYIEEEGYGVPRYCYACAKETSAHDSSIGRSFKSHNSQSFMKTACPDCGKRVKTVGLSQHRRDAHGLTTATDKSEAS